MTRNRKRNRQDKEEVLAARREAAAGMVEQIMALKKEAEDHNLDLLAYLLSMAAHEAINKSADQ